MHWLNAQEKLYRNLKKIKYKNIEQKITKNSQKYEPQQGGMAWRFMAFAFSIASVIVAVSVVFVCIYLATSKIECSCIG